MKCLYKFPCSWGLHKWKYETMSAGCKYYKCIRLMKNGNRCLGHKWSK